MCNGAQVLAKRSPTLGTLVSTKTKCIKLILIGKNKTCTSCVFNGFKYINSMEIYMLLMHRFSALTPYSIITYLMPLKYHVFENIMENGAI